MKNHRLSIVFLASFLIITPFQSAKAFCSSDSFFGNAPNAPGSYERPDAPDCLNNRDDVCDPRDIDDYKSDINAYIDKMERFAQEAEDFAAKAQDFSDSAQGYSRCEIDEINAELNQRL